MNEIVKHIGGEYKVLQSFGGAMGHVYLMFLRG
jgi:hypothetical protein